MKDTLTAPKRKHLRWTADDGFQGRWVSGGEKYQIEVNEEGKFEIWLKSKSDVFKVCHVLSDLPKFDCLCRAKAACEEHHNGA